MGQLGSDLAADGLGIHSDIRHHFLVAGVDVVVDGDQPDAGFLRLFRNDRAQCLVRDDDGDRFDPVADHRIEGRQRQVGVKLNVLSHEVHAELSGFSLCSGDFRDEPRMFPHFIDVAHLDVVSFCRRRSDDRGGDADDR